MKILSSVEHKRRYFEKNVGRPHWLIDLVGYGRKQNTREVNGYQLFDVWSRVCSAEERKALQVWNNLRMSKW